MERVTDFSKGKEIYLIPSIVIYKSFNESVKWFSLRINFLTIEIDTTFYYGRK